MEINDLNILRINRRGFLTLSAGFISAMAIGSFPKAGSAGEIQFPEGRCGGDKKMGKKVLVTYASKYGSTGGVADAIGKELCGKGLAADVALIKNAGDLSSYQASLSGALFTWASGCRRRQIL